MAFSILTRLTTKDSTSTTPRFYFLLTLAQFILSIPILILSAYGLSGLKWAQPADLTIVAASLSLLVTLHTLITHLAPLKFITRFQSNLAGLLFISALQLVIFVIATIWLSVWTATYEYNGIDAYLMEPLIPMIHGHQNSSFRNINANNWEQYRDCLRGAAGISGAVSILLIAGTALLANTFYKQWKAKKAGVAGADESAATVPAPVEGIVADEEKDADASSADAGRREMLHRRTPSVASVTLEK